MTVAADAPATADQRPGPISAGVARRRLITTIVAVPTTAMSQHVTAR